MDNDISDLLRDSGRFDSLFSGIVRDSSSGFTKVLTSYLHALDTLGLKSVSSTYPSSDAGLSSSLHLVSINPNNTIFKMDCESDCVSLHLLKLYPDYIDRPSSTAVRFVTERDDSGRWTTGYSCGDGFSKTRSPSLYDDFSNVKDRLGSYKALAPIIDLNQRYHRL